MRKFILILPLLSLLVLGQLLHVFADKSAPRFSEEALQLIAEETGYLPSETPHNTDCNYDREYGIYLCANEIAITRPPTELAVKTAVQQAIFSTGLLLIPDTTQDRVMAFDPLTGDLLDPNFISDSVHLELPFNAILNASGDGILVSDQTGNLIHEYNLDGSYRGIFAPIGGEDVDILFNPRGIELMEDGTLLVTTTEDNVLMFNSEGVQIGELITQTSGGLDSPFDIYGRSQNWLVSGAISDAVHEYDQNGLYLEDLVQAPGAFLEQLVIGGSGNLFVANFTGERGILSVATDGITSTIAISDDLGHRGVYVLPNGNLLTTAGSTNEGRVYEIDMMGNIIDTKLTSTDAIPITPRYIELVKAPTILYLPAVFNE